MNKVICSKKGRALFCKSDCLHGKAHEPYVFSSEIDCRKESPCMVIESDCKCVAVVMELIEP